MIHNIIIHFICEHFSEQCYKVLLNKIREAKERKKREIKTHYNNNRSYNDIRINIVLDCGHCYIMVLHKCCLFLVLKAASQ